MVSSRKLTALKVALSFIAEPRLFVTLLFWPLVLGLIIVSMQGWFSSAYISALDITPDEYSQRISAEKKDVEILKRHLLSGGAISKTPTICFWQSAGNLEIQEEPECVLEPNDIVIKGAKPEIVAQEDLISTFEGVVSKIHFCNTCESNIVLDMRNSEPVTHIRSLQSMGVLFLAASSEQKRMKNFNLEARKLHDKYKKSIGDIYFYAPGYAFPIQISGMHKVLLLVLNTAAIVLVTLWLSLRSHRKVLDYFAKNGALLPLVAACGKGVFYRAIWVITALRVLAFLAAAVPATIIMFAFSISEKTLNQFVFGDFAEFVLWVLSICCGMATLTMIASISELMQRHNSFAWIYKAIPLLLCFVGAFVWGCTIASHSNTLEILQMVIVSCPVVGIIPILVVPAFKVDPYILSTHTVLSAMVVMLLAKINSRWFAAHLDEI